MSVRRIVVLMALGLAVSGCASLKFWGDDEPEAGKTGEASGEKSDTAEADAAKSKALVDEQDLKLAKLWARVDELEEEAYRQKERVRVLEKGFTLGIIPEEMKDGATKKPAEPPPKEVKPAEDPKPAEPAKAAGGLTKEEQEKYQSLFAKAHGEFRAGRYGRAIAEFAEVERQFGDKADDGAHRYYAALCWWYLKEPNHARELLLSFLKDHPGSPWAPRSKLYLARAEWRLGQRESAVERFRQIIQEHPHEEAAEMAQMELSNLDKKL